MENHADRPEIIDAAGRPRRHSLRYSHTLEGDMHYVAVPVRQDAQRPSAWCGPRSPWRPSTAALASIRLHIAAWSLLVAGLLAAVEPLAFPPHRPAAGAAPAGRRALRPRRSAPPAVDGRLAGDRRPGRDAQPDGGRAGRQDAGRGAAAERARSHPVQHGRRGAGRRRRGARHPPQPGRGPAAGHRRRRAEGRTLPEIVRNTELQRLVAAVLASSSRPKSEIVLRGNGERVLHVHGTVLRCPRAARSACWSCSTTSPS